MSCLSEMVRHCRFRANSKEHLQRYWEETQEENEETQQKQLLERVSNRFKVRLWLRFQRSVARLPLL